MEREDELAPTALMAVFALPGVEANYEVAAICLTNNINDVAVIMRLRGGTSTNPDPRTIANASANSGTNTISVSHTSGTTSSDLAIAAKCYY